jgi:hypothetical protein
MSWIEEEFSDVELGDERLKGRLVKLVEKMEHHATESIPEMCGGWHETKAAYRFFDNDRVTSQKILKPHIEATKKRIKQESVVLLPQDTTELDYSTHLSKIGIGPLNSETHRGILLHPLIALTPERLCLGIVGVESWYRPSIRQKPDHHEQPIEEKESYRWILHYQRAIKLAQECKETQLVVIGDRESDICEFFMAREELGVTENRPDFVIRSGQNRKIILGDGKKAKLYEAMQEAKQVGKIEFDMPSRVNKRRGRHVVQELRACRVTLEAPRQRGNRDELKAVEVTVLYAREINPPTGEKRVEWILITSVDISHQHQAAQVLTWYLARWEIEIYFHVLKNGCRVEDIQLTDSKRFSVCLALYYIVAWRILFLSKIARVCPTLSCEPFFSKTEWKITVLMVKKQQADYPPTLQEMIRMIAQLGGYLARKNDGPPGVKTIWRGLRKLQTIENYHENLQAI